jgi:hypothetical protein
MASSGYQAWAVTAGEVPTTAYWNILGYNDASFNTGNGFNDGIIVPRHFSSALSIANPDPTWTYVGSGGSAPAFQNSWVNYDPTGVAFYQVMYMKDQLGFVHIRGITNGGTVGNNIPIFTLPVGYRPKLDMRFAVVSYTGEGNADVQSNGNVCLENGSNTFAFLDNIYFKAEQ